MAVESDLSNETLCLSIERQRGEKSNESWPLCYLFNFGGRAEWKQNTNSVGSKELHLKLDMLAA
jgi:hypothetical protein